MSSFVRHEGCPNCGSRDNLGVWTDGHKWCFGCGYYERGNETLETIQQRIAALRNNQQEDTLPQNGLTLPADYTTNIPPLPKTWLTQYGLTEKEIVKNHIGWSPSRSELVYPIFSDGVLLAYQGRYFGPNKRERFSTQGSVESVIHFIGPNSTTGVLVEDTVSQIKVARQVQTMALWGSNVSELRLTRLARVVTNLVIWLDHDKASYAMKVMKRAQALFEHVACVVTLYDPKEYSDDEIRRHLEKGTAISGGVS